MTTAPERRRGWRYLRGVMVPLLLWTVFVGALFAYTMRSGTNADEQYDEAALREWIEEARVHRETLPQLVREYRQNPTRENEDKVRSHLAALGDVTKMYSGELPLFPTIYRLELSVEEPGSTPKAIVWDSQWARRPDRFHPLPVKLYDDKGNEIATLNVYHQLHAFNFKRQRDQQAAQARQRWTIGLAAGATALAFLWVFLAQRSQGERERQRARAQQQIDQAERLLLEGELRREEAERRHQEAERKLLEQRLATQAAERQALELKSQLYASIGIMAGSYAHNIKNLLVRPNDLLRRCLEGDALSADQQHMLREARQTLGTVTERLQQILRTVRRDPSRAETSKLDLNAVIGDLQRTWKDLAREKWKLALSLELSPDPLLIEGDVSHLQQAVENLLFNARDATFEMRNHQRGEARHVNVSGPRDRRQALIAAAAWKGTVVLRTRRQGERAVLEVQDNGIGMPDEVRRRCTETHFSTKRDNAVYEGNTTGMGLGLSFVVAVLEHHRATLEIESAPLQGALFRLSFPLAPVPVTDATHTPVAVKPD
jgi:signal transduction histidine kinase